MALAGWSLRVVRRLEAAAALAPRAADAMRLAAEAGDQLSGAAAGGAGARIVVGHRRDARSPGARPTRSGPQPRMVTSGALSVGSARRMVGGTSRSVSGRSRP